jgi:hypothetical protein
MTIKYTNIFLSKALQNLSKLGFLVWNWTVWQPCINSVTKFTAKYGALLDMVFPIKVFVSYDAKLW